MRYTVECGRCFTKSGHPGFLNLQIHYPVHEIDKKGNNLILQSVYQYCRPKFRHDSVAVMGMIMNQY